MQVDKTGHQGPSTREGDVEEKPADTKICHTVESVEKSTSTEVC